MSLLPAHTVSWRRPPVALVQLWYLRLEFADGSKLDVETQALDFVWARERAADHAWKHRGPHTHVDWRGAVGFVDCAPAEERTR